MNGGVIAHSDIYKRSNRVLAHAQQTRQLAFLPYRKPHQNLKDASDVGSRTVLVTALVAPILFTIHNHTSASGVCQPSDVKR
eukprot:scaffold778_cov81-Skeletonema_dohrnii-CCMP3373.AAC.1